MGIAIGVLRGGVEGLCPRLLLSDGSVRGRMPRNRLAPAVLGRKNQFDCKVAEWDMLPVTLRLLRSTHPPALATDLCWRHLLLLGCRLRETTLAHLALTGEEGTVTLMGAATQTRDDQPLALRDLELVEDVRLRRTALAIPRLVQVAGDFFQGLALEVGHRPPIQLAVEKCFGRSSHGCSLLLGIAQACA